MFAVNKTIATVVRSAAQSIRAPSINDPVSQGLKSSTRSATAVQIRMRSAARHVSLGFSINVAEGSDGTHELMYINKLEYLDNDKKSMKEKEYYEKPTRKRYFKKRNGDRNNKIRQIRGLVEYINWKREQDFRDPSKRRNRKGSILISFPMNGPYGY